MSTKPIGPIRQAWYRWKALKLPWRKRFLVGLDLQGNTFWEFRDTLSSHQNRMRRIVQYPASTHYSEIKISPQWHQWLRHTRKDPPTLTEQSQDLVRQRNLKRLAAEADARWAAKPSYLDTPGRAQPLTASGVKDPRVYVESEEAEVGTEARNAISRTLEDRIRDTDANLGNRVAREHGSRIVEESGAGASREVPTKKGESRLKDKKEQLDPWKHARGGPSEEWQPQAWGGTVAPRKGL